MNTSSKLRKQLIEFHCVGKHPIVDVPTIPPADRVKLRAKLVAEEAFEFLEALFGTTPVLRELKARTLYAIEHECDGEFAARVEDTSFSCMPFIADALADLDYVVEGSRLEFGIDGGPVADEVHRANMTKFGPGSWKREDGKTMKPKNWQPPDIKGVLRRQGWKG